MLQPFLPHAQVSPIGMHMGQKHNAARAAPGALALSAAKRPHFYLQ
jgi:hypothetical protein